MYPASRFSEAVDAIKTRTTLEAVDFRLNHGTSPNPAKTTGARFIQPRTSVNTLPVYDDQGNLFAGSIIGRADTAVSVPANTGPGTIIQFQNNRRQTQYAIVQKTKKKRIQVKKISPNQYSDLITKHPHTDVVSVGEEHLGPISSRSGILRSLFDALDPTETIFFKFVLKLLLGNIFELESVWEVFIILYFRLMLIAGLIILASYLLLNLF